MRRPLISILFAAAAVAFISETTDGQDLNTLLVKFINGLRSGKVVMQAGTAPTLTSCGTGTVLTGSKDGAGGFTVTGATACTVTFSAAWSVAPICVAEDITANRGNISAISTTAMTVSNLTDGDVVRWLCVGTS